MAFMKTSYPVTHSNTIPLSEVFPKLGEIKDDMVWDGTAWIQKPEEEPQEPPENVDG